MIAGAICGAWRPRGADSGRSSGCGGLFYGSPLYRLTLLGRAPEQVLQAPTDPWPGDAERGRRLIAGQWRLAGQTLAFDAKQGAPQW